MSEESHVATRHGTGDVSVQVICDNNPCADGLETAWGFSAFISGTDKTILFDAGSDGSLLLNNMKQLAIDPYGIDVVVVSHPHGDHTGGLGDFLKENSNATVYLPTSVPSKLKRTVQQSAARVIEVKEPVTICENVYSTGQHGKLIKEQSLIIQTQRGSIVMTGCAHPGILRMVNAARDSVQSSILLVMGGFHLEWATAGKIERIISAFKQWHVQYVGPCHCSGHKARSLFEKHYSKKYIDVGAGKAIALADLL